MRVLKGLSAVRRPPRRAVVTVGVFDGVHLAHQRVIRTMVRHACRLGGTSVVITFDPDPQTVLDPAHAQPSLMSLEVRIEQLRALGVACVWIIPFTKRFSRMTAEEFIERVLSRKLRAAMLIVGESFVFGRNRRGDMDVLKTLGPSRGMRIVPVRSVTRAGSLVSSSRIRRLIGRGRLGQARQLLGRAHALSGTVVRGVGRGRGLGFPTANVRLRAQVLPPRGVYAVLVHSGPARHSRRKGRSWPRPLRDKGRGWRGVMNLGVRPTFGASALTCEVHLLRFSGSLRGRDLSLVLLARLRSERRFPNAAALSAQVRRDIAHARRLFAVTP